MFTVYTLCSPEDSRVRYVGMTGQTLPDRLLGHLKDPHNPHKRNWIEKLRIQNLRPCIEPVITGLTLEQAAEFERQFIFYLRDTGTDLINLSTGGEKGPLGCVRSKETRLKLASQKMGIKNPSFGKRLSEHGRAKLSAALTGRKFSESHKMNLSLSARGRRHSEETKIKISQAQLGKCRGPRSAETLAKIAATKLRNKHGH